ncbi:longevity assurance factor, putative [Pediculus humanus corporis]|uniref:Longevity assurance factor, putative n=1 Tax=Pediculus humanus subsp. corporis TaxID=121224 RepID=E0VDG7_PEDHC|nr:longevity assurance factor, putative [Pediculus humanus corporis]EEB11423.1 longevity assurance factor, putative [Pediculus humanus corporis]
MTERQVERWLRVRRAMDKPTTLKKFCENSFRCTYYIYSFTYGLIVLWDKPWLWNINYCWYGYPHQSVSNDIWWYYMISMSFYWSLAVSQFFDVKHKDFWQMFIHHIATIILMDFSWVCNMHRIGSLVLVIHDCADVLLEGAKMAKYANYQRVCDGLFVVFTLVWIMTRLGLYPFWIMRNTTVQAPKIVDMFPAYYIFNSLLFLLLALHIFWTYLILKIAYNSLLVGKMEGDIRSSSDEEIESSPSPSISENGVKKHD